MAMFTDIARDDERADVLTRLRRDIEDMHRAAQRREIELQGTHDEGRMCAVLAEQRAYRDVLALIDAMDTTDNEPQPTNHYRHGDT